MNPCYCIKIRRAANEITQLYSKYIEPTGLTINQFSLLASLDRMGSASTSSFARNVGLDRSTLVRTLRPLLQKGLIEDLSTPTGRNRKLKVTEDGLAMLNFGRPFWKKAQKEIEQRVGAENMELFLTLLEAAAGGPMELI